MKRFVTQKTLTIKDFNIVRKKLNRKKLDPLIPDYTGEKHVEKVSLQLFRYNQDNFSEEPEYSENKFDGFPVDGNQYWLNIHGIHDIDIVKNICDKLEIHSLAIQDILDVNQRPKFQEYENYWFFSLKSILPSKSMQIESEQISFILGNNFLVSFQEKKADYFDHIRHRIREKLGILRERGTDYLLFLLLEAILDNYFKTVDNIEAEIEKLGIIDINTDPSPEVLSTIDFYRRLIHEIKKTIIPVKEFVNKVEREQFSFINQKHIKYFYELKDLCLSLIDDCDQNDAKLDSTINLFFSVQGHRMNQVMKTLTVVATVFIPLTFIAGIYGMNFTNMPELNWKWGYFGVWGVILVVFIVMLTYFKRKKWY